MLATELAEPEPDVMAVWITGGGVPLPNVFCFDKIKRSVESALLPADVDDELDLVDSLPEIFIGFDGV